MDVTWWFPLAVLIVGAALWRFAPGRLSDAGRIWFAIGSLVLTWHLASATFALHVR